MTETDEEGRLDLHGDGEDIKRFMAELRKKHMNITKLSGSYTSNPSTGDEGLEVSFTCRMEDGDIEAIYHEKTPSCASIEEAEEMRIFKKMTIKVPQAIYDEEKHGDFVDMAKKWLGDMGVDVELQVTEKEETDRD